MIEAAHQTSARYPAGVSEFEATGLTPRYGERLAAPYVAESRLTIGLQHRQTIDIELNGTHLLIGEIVEVELDSEVIAEDGWIDLAALDSVTAPSGSSAGTSRTGPCGRWTRCRNAP